MIKVFVGGSRHVSRLDAQVIKRLDNIVLKKLPVVIGDANGVDKSVQQYLNEKRYRHVEVFCTKDVCRNNLGDWTTRRVPTETRSRDFAFYSAKDRAMTQEATVGLMVWDGNSIGTLLNVLRLVNQGKKVAVYAVRDKCFRELTNGIAEWHVFISRYDTKLRHKVEQLATLEAHPAKLPIQTSFAV